MTDKEEKTNIGNEVRMLFLKRFLTVFLPLSLAVVVVTVTMYRMDRNGAMGVLATSERDGAKYQKQAIIDDLSSSVFSDLTYLTKVSELREFFKKKNSATYNKLAGEYYAFASAKTIYDQIRLIGLDGMELIRINSNGGNFNTVPVDELQNKSDRYYFKEAIGLNKSEVFISSFDLNIEAGEIEFPLKPMIRFAAPVFDEQGEKQGILVLNYLGAKLIHRLNSTFQSKRGHFMLLNSSGYYLFGMSRKDEWGFMFEDRKDRTFARQYPEAWEQVSAQESGQVLSQGDLFTFVTVRLYGKTSGMKDTKDATPVNMPYWKIISHVPASMLNVGSSIWRFILPSLAMIILIGFIAWFIARAEEAARDEREILENAKSELEEWVLERTNELTRTNKVLVKEVAERMRSEEDLRASEDVLRAGEERYRELVDSVHAITWEAEADTMTCTFISRQAEDILRYPTRMWLTGKELWPGIIHPEDRERVLDSCKKVVSSVRNVELDYRMVAADDKVVWIHDIVRPVQDKSGRVSHIRGLMIDITDHKRLEDEKLKAGKLASLGLLAGGIAHDFNNILATLLALLNLAKIRAAKGKDVVENIIKAENSVHRAAALTLQLLTFSRGGAPIRKTASIGELIKDTVNFVVSGSNVKCEFSIPEDLWPVDVDEGQMSQVINNLVINADHAMPDGGSIEVGAENITIEAGGSVPLLPGRYVRIKVSDCGMGISEKDLPHLFDPYFTTKEGGYGLGLATSYSIVKKHEGLITVHSEKGKGSTFYTYLPASSGTLKTCRKEADESSRRVPGRILLMDDEDDLRMAMPGLLEHCGYTPSIAADGYEAISMYVKAMEEDAPFDVVIMDLTIRGGMGGEEAIKRLLEIDPEVKAIVSSGYSNDKIMAEYETYGFCGVLAKPYKVDKLDDLLQEILKGMGKG